MRRIFFCTDYLVSGGVERHLTELVTHLVRTVFDPRVLILYGECSGRALHFAPCLQTAGIPFETLDLGWSPLDKAHGISGSQVLPIPFHTAYCLIFPTHIQSPDRVHRQLHESEP